MASVCYVGRPQTLEELIPIDVRERWGIQTCTPIQWESNSYNILETQEREIADGNTIEIRYKEGRQDSKIREVMRAHKVQTVHKMETNLQKFREWAVSQGKKVRLIQE